jgi:hypothetical protein
VEADSTVDDPREALGNKIWLTVTFQTRLLLKRDDGVVATAAQALRLTCVS